MKLTRFYPLLLIALSPLSPSADEAPQLPPAILELQQKAESGDAEAQNSLGENYNNGDGVEMDEAKAVYWFKRSAEQGNADGLCNLGECYLYGYGIDRTGHEKEYDELAVKYFTAAMEGGSIRAHSMVAMCHLLAKGGLEYNMGKARDLLQYAADHGEEDAKKALAMLLQNQDGIASNQEGDPAAEMFQQLFKAYQQGDETPEILVYIAYCYQMGNYVECDIDKAIELYEKAADQGNSTAQFALSMLLQERELTERNKELSDQYLNKAAEQGNVLAYAALLDRNNDPEKLEFIIKSAEKGDTLAQVVLGGYYYSLSDQQEDQRKQAIVWWEKAAEQGLALAEYQLGICYNEGDLVERDVKKALDYWRRASSHGFSEAQIDLLRFFRDNGTEHTTQEELEHLRSALEKKGLHREDYVNSNVISNLLAWLYDALSVVLSKFA